jgi:molybdenum cofactor guanylyltransferase
VHPTNPRIVILSTLLTTSWGEPRSCLRTAGMSRATVMLTDCLTGLWRRLADERDPTSLSIDGVVAAVGVVLVGGRSSRMGSPKCDLEWHGSTLLRRTTGILARVVDGPVLVVRAAGQVLPDLGAGVEVHDDTREGRGPLQGIAVALGVAADRADVAFVCSTDLPFLHVAFVRAVLRALTDDVDVALPVARGHPQPLAAGYRTSLALLADELVAADRLRAASLLDQCRVTRLDDAALRADPMVAALDPALDSVVNINEPADYVQARALPPPEITVQRFGVLAGRGGRGPRTVRAATLAEAAAAVSLPLDQRVLAALNGVRVTRDGHLPLVTGDAVAFVCADEGR